MWSEGHASHHEAVDTTPDGAVDVLRYDRETGRLYPPTQQPR
jgi:fatty-acid desaturase